MRWSTPGRPGREAAALDLARLAAERVPGADPASWWALTTLSDDRPLRPEGAVSPCRRPRSTASVTATCAGCSPRCGGEGPSVGAANIGTLVHDIAAELGDVDADTMRSEVEARWGRLGLPPGWLSRRQLGEAQAMVTRLARYFVEAREAGWERVGVELDMRVELGRALLRGRVDRLERDPEGALRVVDLKTGSSKPTASEMERHGQLGAYQAAVEHGAFADHGTRSAGAALLQVGKAAGARTTLQVQPPLAGDDQPGWADELVTGTAEGMAGARFLATVGPACQFCAVRSSCPVQPRGKGDLMAHRYSAGQIASALGNPTPTRRAAGGHRGAAAAFARGRRGRLGQDRDDGLPGGLAGRQRPRRAGPGARSDVHPQGRDRAGRAHRPAPAPAAARRAVDACAEEDGAEVLGGTPTVSTYHSYAGRLVREHVLRLGIEPESRLLSEAAAWQFAAEVVDRYDGPMDDVGFAASTVTAAVVDLAGEMAEHLLEPADLERFIDAFEARCSRCPRAPSRARTCPRASRTP